MELLDEIESRASAPKEVLVGLQKQFLSEQVTGQQVNLLAPENWGKLITGTDPRLEKLIDWRKKDFSSKIIMK